MRSLGDVEANEMAKTMTVTARIYAYHDGDSELDITDEEVPSALAAVIELVARDARQRLQRVAAANRGNRAAAVQLTRSSRRISETSFLAVKAAAE